MARRRTRSAEDNISIKVVVTGGDVMKYIFDHEPTLKELLETADLEADDALSVRVNGECAELKDTLEDGDDVTLTSKIKGG